MGVCHGRQDRTRQIYIRAQGQHQLSGMESRERDVPTVEAGREVVGVELVIGTELVVGMAVVGATVGMTLDATLVTTSCEHHQRPLPRLSQQTPCSARSSSPTLARRVPPSPQLLHIQQRVNQFSPGITSPPPIGPNKVAPFPSPALPLSFPLPSLVSGPGNSSDRGMLSRRISWDEEREQGRTLVLPAPVEEWEAVSCG